MHGDNDAAEQVDVVVVVDFGVDADHFEKCFRILEMAVHCVWRTREGLAMHPVDGVDDSVESGAEVADVPHPVEHWCDVLVASAESEHRENNGQNRSDKNGKLNDYQETILR